ncbi:MAG: hypothetical protein ACOX3S_03910 [Anaerolineae bacterium]|jgi:hypothetical protein
MAVQTQLAAAGNEGAHESSEAVRRYFSMDPGLDCGQQVLLGAMGHLLIDRDAFIAGRDANIVQLPVGNKDARLEAPRSHLPLKRPEAYCVFVWMTRRDPVEKGVHVVDRDVKADDHTPAGGISGCER